MSSSPDSPLSRFWDEYLHFVKREATAFVDARNIPKLTEGEWRDWSMEVLRGLDARLDVLIRDMAMDAIRTGDRQDIATHVGMGFEIYPEMRSFLTEALLSSKSKFANRPPRQSTGAQYSQIALYVHFQLQTCPQKKLGEIYAAAEGVFGRERKTIETAYRSRKEMAALVTKGMISVLALQLMVLRAHP